MRTPALAFAALALLPLGCSEDSGGDPPCAAGTAWAPGVPVFRESTAGRGLDGVEGVRLSVTDLDADGLPDLFVRRSGGGADDFAPGGRRVTWLLRNTGGGRFEDVTEASGLVAPRQPGDARIGRPAEIAVFGDLDHDGDLDAFTAFANADPANPATESAEVLLNDGTGRFALGPEDASVRAAGRLAPRSAAAFVDVDRDGLLDLWIGNGAVSGRAPSADELHRGTGGGHFENVTTDLGIRTKAWQRVEDLNAALAHSNAWAVAACDLNGDGAPELLASSYGRAPNHLWQALPDGTYRNRSIESGYAFDERTDWTDNESARCWCQLHRDDEGCASVPAPRIACNTDADAFRWNHGTDREPYRLGGNSGTTVCADVNGDGALDLLTTEIVHWDVGSSSDPSELLVNTGAAEVRFERPGNEATGLARNHDRVDWNDGDITAAVFDFDNDGHPDVWIGSTDYPGTRGHLFHGQGDGTFVPVPPEVGIDSLAAHGVAVADFDRDGDLDVVVGHSRARCEDQCYETAQVRYFENVLGSAGNWVQLALEGGPGTNRSAIGARVEVRAGGRLGVQEVGGGHGHYGIQHDLALHFGLGDTCEAEVMVRWPDAAATTETFAVRAGRRYRVVQGQKPVAE